jgi:hypothetical protein
VRACCFRTDGDPDGDANTVPHRARQTSRVPTSAVGGANIAGPYFGLRARAPTPGFSWAKEVRAVNASSPQGAICVTRGRKPAVKWRMDSSRIAATRSSAATRATRASRNLRRDWDAGRALIEPRRGGTEMTRSPEGGQIRLISLDEERRCAAFNALVRSPDLRRRVAIRTQASDHTTTMAHNVRRSSRRINRQSNFDYRLRSEGNNPRKRAESGE